MTVNNAVNIFAGTVIMSSLLLAHFMQQINLGHPGWIWLTFFAGFNLFQMGFTGFCPAKFLFKKFGLKDSDGSCCS